MSHLLKTTFAQSSLSPCKPLSAWRVSQNAQQHPGRNTTWPTASPSCWINYTSRFESETIPSVSKLSMPSRQNAISAFSSIGIRLSWARQVLEACKCFNGAPERGTPLRYCVRPGQGRTRHSNWGGNAGECLERHCRGHLLTAPQHKRHRLARECWRERRRERVGC